MNIENLSTAREKALNAYKLAKIDFLSTVTKQNIKGDFEKWKIFCNARLDCIKLGCRL